MNFLRSISAMLIVGLFCLGFGAILAPDMPKAHAQQGVKDLTAGFQGSLTSAANAVVVTATTISGSGLPVVAPPGTTAANARIRVKHVHVWKAASGTISIIENPSTGSNVTICTIGVIANTPFDAKAGQNELLGINGYLTQAGSAIEVLVNDNTGALTAGTVTYSLE